MSLLLTSITPVVLCGGSGKRQWPLSRTRFSKQFACLTGKESHLQQAAQRLSRLANRDIQGSAPHIVTGEDHHSLAPEQLREIGIDFGAALLEPLSRNTAPTQTLPTRAGIETGEEPMLIVTPADQPDFD